jgi:hypothetical protein
MSSVATREFLRSVTKRTDLRRTGVLGWLPGWVQRRFPVRPVCDLHPEFGYIGSAHRRLRTLRIVVAFTVFGLIAGASGVGVFMATPDPDPMRAMTLAPGKDLAPAAESLPTVAADAGAAAAARAPAADAEASLRCRQNPEQRGNCVFAVRKPRHVLALNERPAIAAVPIGHPDGPAVLPSEPEIPATEPAGLTKPEDIAVAVTVEAEPEAQSQTASVEQPAAAPVVSASTARVRSKIVRRRDRDEGRHARVRDRNEYSRDRHQISAWRSYSYANQSGYARLW